MQFTSAALSVLKSAEGCCLRAYQDIAGVWTIGYGHTGLEVTAGLCWVQQQADDCLERDLHEFASRVAALISWSTVSNNQFSALVVFAYNVGIGALAHSTVLKRVNEGSLADVPAALLMWDVIHDPQTHQPFVSSGLRNRRLREVSLWNTQDRVPAEPPISTSPSSVSPVSDNTLRLGDQGKSVRLLQTLLAFHGYLIDGGFGSETADALEAFQKANGLVQDGVAGPVTWAALIKT